MQNALGIPHKDGQMVHKTSWMHRAGGGGAAVTLVCRRGLHHITQSEISCTDTTTGGSGVKRELIIKMQNPHTT